MQQRFLGSTGLSVSRLGLGTMTWGRDTDEHEAREQLVAFVEAGGNLVDTAAGYTDGDSERLIGSLIGDVCARDEIVLATKAGISRRGRDRVTNASRGHLITTLDASLKRLGRRPRRPVAGAHLGRRCSARGDAVRPGLRGEHRACVVRRGEQLLRLAVGPGRDLAACCAGPGHAGLPPGGVLPAQPRREAEIVPAALAWGWASCRGRPLGRGVLTGKYRDGTPADSRAASPHFSTFVGRYLGEPSQRVVEAVARAAEGLGWSMLEVSLAWVRDRPGVTAPIIGARTAAQLRESLGVEECELPVEIIQALEDVSADLEVARMTSAKQRRSEQRALRPGVEYEFDRLLISREHSRGAVTRMLVELAEQGGWELERVRLGPDGTRRVQLRRRIIRQRIAYLI